MTKASESDSKKIVNVVDEFDAAIQGTGYNGHFKNWRKNKNNPYAFNFEINEKEKIFNDSRGFEKPSQTAEGKRVLTAIMRVSGIIMLISVLINNIVSKVFVGMLGLIGVNIHTSVFNSSLYGGATEIVTVSLVISLLSWFVPIVYFHLKTKMPFKAGVMHKVRDSAEILTAIGFALIVCTVSCLPAAYSSSSKDLYTYFASIDADVSVWKQTDFIVYIVVDVIVLSALKELLLRGGLFSALRQFGDELAILITSIMAALFTGSYLQMPGALMVSFVASVGMIRSGTVLTAVFVHIIYKMYLLAIIILESNTSENMLPQRNLFMLVVFAAGVIIAAFTMIVLKRNRKFYLVHYHSEVSFPKRFFYAFITFPFLPVVILCLMQATISLIF